MATGPWTTISIPTALYNELAQHIPKRAPSVQAWVAKWASIGHMVDCLLEEKGSLTPQELLTGLQGILEPED